MSYADHLEAEPLASPDPLAQAGPATRRRAWGESLGSIPVNLSWALLTVVFLVAVPMRRLTDAGEPVIPWALWAVLAVWLVVNLVCTRLVWNRLEVPVAETVDDVRARPGTSLLADALRRLRRNQLATLASTLLVVLLVLCFGSYLLNWAVKAGVESADPTSFYSLHLDYERQDEDVSFQPPTATHWFGTDQLGRDVFARTLYGGTISFAVGIVATLVSLLIGVSWGATSGYFGGRLDNVMMRIVDIMYGLPFLFLVILVLSLVNGLKASASKDRPVLQKLEALEIAAPPTEANAAAAAESLVADMTSEEELMTAEQGEAFVAEVRDAVAAGDLAEAQAAVAARRGEYVEFLKPEDRSSVEAAVWLADYLEPVTVMFFALGLVSWLTMARISRGQVLSLRQREYVTAARTVGAGHGRIIFSHIVPNLLGPVVIYTTLTIPAVMLSEAFLSFIGLGVTEPQCSWGSLVSQGLQGINVVRPYWWLLVYPAAAICVTLFSLNFLGDGLRDALDPKQNA